jgi:hypothetical protein
MRPKIGISFPFFPRKRSQVDFPDDFAGLRVHVVNGTGLFESFLRFDNFRIIQIGVSGVSGSVPAFVMIEYHHLCHDIEFGPRVFKKIRPR